MVVMISNGQRGGLDEYYETGADVVIAYPVAVGPDAAASMRETIDAFAPGRT